LAVSDDLLLEVFVLYCKLLVHINGTTAEVEKVQMKERSGEEESGENKKY
jgi:hypothetical protein